MIKRPKIVMLDEAMSSLDSDGEEKILAAIKQNRAGLKLITVSHIRITRRSRIVAEFNLTFSSIIGKLITKSY